MPKVPDEFLLELEDEKKLAAKLANEKSAPSSKRSEMLAVSLLDSRRLDPVLWHKLFSGKLDLVKPVKAGTSKEAALKFTCDLLTAAVVCDVLRSEDRRASRRVSRVYLLRDKIWVQLSSSVVLIDVQEHQNDDGVKSKIVLNSDVFDVDLGPKQMPYVKPARMDLGCRRVVSKKQVHEE